MIRRIWKNGWWLFRDTVEHLLSSLYPVKEFSKRVDEAPWDKYVSKSMDPMRELEPFESWAGNVQKWQSHSHLRYHDRKMYVVNSLRRRVA